MNTFIEVEATPRSLSMRGLIDGVGINDAPYIINIKVDGSYVMCPYYKTWKSMLARCYSANFQSANPSYRGCWVCDEWLYFMNFRMWMEKQDWEGLFLDKDIIVKGNKCYSPDTCIFVTRQVNSILIDRAADRGGCVVGVSWSKSNGKYCAKCSVDSKQVNLGFYDSEEEASFAYRVFKGNVVKVIAEQQEDIRLVDALMEIAAGYLNETS